MFITLTGGQLNLVITRMKYGAMTSIKDVRNMSKAKQKGTSAETAVVNWLKTEGWLYAERRALQGNLDKGDINMGAPIVIEVKNCKTITLSEWLKELKVEMENAGVSVGSVIAKKRGTTDVAEWYAIMPASVLAVLLKEAGY
jgi:hypothetical protein